MTVRVSVIIPVLNRARLVPLAIESALRCQAESQEIVVVDCGSHDGSADVASSYAPEVRVLRGAYGNAAAARNAGLANSSGELVAFLDSDDEALPGKTHELVDILMRRMNVVLVHGTTEVIDDSGRRLEAGERAQATSMKRAMEIGTSYSALARFNSMFTSATLMRRIAIEEAGGYDETLDALEDWDLYLRLSLVGELVYADIPAARYRTWSGNVPWDTTARASIRVAEKHLAWLEHTDVAGRDEARSAFLARLAGSHYTLLQLTEARRAAVRALVADPVRALRSPEVRRAATRWVVPRRILQRRRPTEVR